MNEEQPTPLASGECWIWVMAKAHAKDERPDVYVGRARPEGIDLADPGSIPNDIRLTISPFVRIENSAPADANRWHAVGNVQAKYILVFNGCAADKKRTKPDRLVIGSSFGETIILSRCEEDAKTIRPLLGSPA